MMPSIRRRPAGSAAAMAAVLFLAGCATNPDGSQPNLLSDIGTTFGAADPNLTPEQRALREQEEEYSEARLTSAAAGAALGALAGALLGAAVGGRDGAVAGAGIGLVAGGAAGYVGGTYLTRDNQDFVASRDTLQADIEAARADSAKMERNVQVAQGALSAQRRQLDTLNADLRAGRITEQQARARVGAAGEDLASVRALAEESERRLAGLNASAAAYRDAGEATTDLDREISRQKAQTASLRNVERSMINVIDRTPANLRPVA
jgi:hypothetical protein